MKRVINTIIKIIKHILALPTYPLFAIMWVLKQVNLCIDFVIEKYIKLLKMIIK